MKKLIGRRWNWGSASWRALPLPAVCFLEDGGARQFWRFLNEDVDPWVWWVIIGILILIAGYSLRSYFTGSVLKYHPHISPEERERRRVAEELRRSEAAEARRLGDKMRTRQGAEAQAHALKAGRRLKVDSQGAAQPRANKPWFKSSSPGAGKGGAAVDQIDAQLRDARGYRAGARGEPSETISSSRAPVVPKVTAGGLDSIDPLVQNVDRMIGELSSGIEKLSATVKGLEGRFETISDQMQKASDADRKSRSAVEVNIANEIREKIDKTQAGLKSDFDARLGSLKGSFVDPVVRSIQGIEKSLKEQISEAEKNWKLAEREKEYVLIAWDLYGNAATADQLRNRQKKGEHIDIDSLGKLIRNTRKTLQEFKDHRLITGRDELEAADKLKDRLDTMEAMLEKIRGSNADELEKYVKENFQVLFLPTVYPDEETLQDVSYEVIGRFGADQALGRLARFTHYVLPIAIGDLLKDREFRSINPKQGDVFDETRHNAVRPIPTTDPTKQNKIHSVIRPGLEYKGKVPIKAQVVRLIKP